MCFVVVLGQVKVADDGDDERLVQYGAEFVLDITEGLALGIENVIIFTYSELGTETVTDVITGPGWLSHFNC